MKQYLAPFQGHDIASVLRHVQPPLPQKETEAKLGDGQTTHSGPFFTTLRYNSIVVFEVGHNNSN